MTTRSEVYAAIDGERNHQDALGGDRIDGHMPSVGDECTMVLTYARRAADAYADNAGDTAALDALRKVAALCVRCLEHHGCPRR